MRVATVMIAVMLAGCAPPAEVAAPADFARDQAEIQVALARSAEAWNQGDLPGHLAPYLPDVTFMTRNGPRPGVEAIETAFREKYFNEGRPKQQLSFERIEVRRLADDALLSTGRFLLSGGGLDEQSGWFTLIWVRGEQGWRVLHDHSS